MKDHRFIDLLNLYIDRQITAEETAELEAEIQQSPQRQAVYRQYCQIHSATKLVYESFRAGATEQPVMPSGRPATVELFENRRRTARWTYAAGGLAAAACVAFAFVRYNHPNLNTDTQAMLAKPQPVAVAAVAVPVKAVAAPAQAAVAVAPAPNLISLRNADTPANYSAMLAALREQDEERALANERWQAARAQSLFDDHLFDAKYVQPATEPEQRTLRRQTAQQVEMTVFQFQR